MNFLTPPPAQTWKAIEIFLAIAYESEPSAAVQSRLQALKTASEDQFYAVSVFERPASAEHSRCSLRLGNRFYPHMKLVIEPSPHGTQVLYRVDTHDQHVLLAPASAEAAAFAELARKNQELSTRIEAAWDAHGLPTFKQFLREDLARRRKELAANASS